MNVSQYQLTPSPQDWGRLVNLLLPFRTIRFMNWQQTNYPGRRSVADLPLWDWRTNLLGAWKDWGGMPLDNMITLANTIQARGWYCIPHEADEGLMQSMIEYIVTHSAQRPIIEYSNEITFNGLFPQYNWATAYGMRNGVESMTNNPKEYAIRVAADRIGRISQMVNARADVVACGQFYDPQVGELLLSIVGDAITMYGVAPYYGHRLRAYQQDMTVQKLADGCFTHLVTEVREAVEKHRTLAAEYGVQLVGYESGPHLFSSLYRNGGYRLSEIESERERRLMAQYNRSHQCAEHIRLLRSLWGGCLLLPYSLITRYDNQSFGHVEITADGGWRPLPKYEAVCEVV